MGASHSGPEVLQSLKALHSCIHGVEEEASSSDADSAEAQDEKQKFISGHSYFMQSCNEAGPRLGTGWNELRDDQKSAYTRIGEPHATLRA